MKQIYPIIALVVLLAGLTFFASNFGVTTDASGGLQIDRRDPAQSPGLSLPPLFGGGSASGQQNTPVSTPGGGRPVSGAEFIRIGSFNIQVFGEAKLRKPEVVDVLAKTVRNFDIVAIQEVRAQSQGVLPQFLDAVNAGGSHYDYVIGERVGRTSSKEQYAYIFNTDTIEVDRRTLYTVTDPDDLLHREPLVAWFRCRTADPSQAFTFSLVNIHTDPDEVDVRNPNNELDVLDDVLRAVRDDGRGEDDVILLGDFNAGARDMGHLGRVPNVTFVISGNMATNIRGTAQYDNIVFDLLATQEFLGRGGVFDFLREYNLSMKQAEAVSDHIPVWAEFSVYEGGLPGRVATRPRPYAGQTLPPARSPSYAADSPASDSRDRRYAPAPQYTADPRAPGDYNGYSRSSNPQPPRGSRTTSRW